MLILEFNGKQDTWLVLCIVDCLFEFIKYSQGRHEYD